MRHVLARHRTVGPLLAGAALTVAPLALYGLAYAALRSFGLDHPSAAIAPVAGPFIAFALYRIGAELLYGERGVSRD